MNIAGKLKGGTVLSGLALAGMFVFMQHHAAGFRLQYPQANQVHVFGASAMEDAAFLAFGLRRFGADLNFIRLMQYYGTPEEIEDPEAERLGKYYMYGFGEPPHHHADEGVYSELYARTLHVMSLDPYFKFAVLYSAGALAFNLKRPDEALDILRTAKTYMPREWKYDAYVAAIGYSKSDDPARVADILDNVVRDPECPAMVKQLTAFLNKKVKRYRRAYEIYAELAASGSPEYAENSRRQMALLLPYLK